MAARPGIEQRFPQWRRGAPAFRHGDISRLIFSFELKKAAAPLDKSGEKIIMRKYGMPSPLRAGAEALFHTDKTAPPYTEKPCFLYGAPRFPVRKN